MYYEKMKGFHVLMTNFSKGVIVETVKCSKKYFYIKYL